MDTIKNYLRLVRCNNLLFLSIMMYVMEKWVAVPVMNRIGLWEQMPWWMLLLLTLAIVLTAAGGYVINDYFDVKIDRINRPDKLIVTISVSKVQAMRLFQVLTVTGMLTGFTVSYLCRSLQLAIIFMLVPGLLWFYSTSYKRMLVVGNLIIAFVSALVPLTIAIANMALMTKEYGNAMQYIPIGKSLFYWLGGFSLLAFLTTWIREIVKDLQDETGDRELECHTMPIVCGEMWTRVVVTILIVLTAAIICFFNWQILPFDSSWSSLSTRYVVFAMLVPLACEIALLWSAKIPSDYRSAQGLMKFVMFLGVMYGFVIIKLLI